MCVLYHLGKDNVVADALSHMTMGNVSHIDEFNKNLVRDVHKLPRLGMRLEDSQNGGFIVHHSSSLVIEVKSKQQLNQSLMELKESIVSNIYQSFSLGEGWCLKV